GDAAATDAAIASAAHVTEMKIINNRLVPNPMEPRAALGVYDEGEDHYTLWTTSQNPHVARLVLSAFYNVAPENKLRVIAPDVGGGFGSKIYIYPEEIVCLWASKRTGVPVKWNCDRTEAFLTDAHGRDHVSTVKMAFDANNRITGFKVDTIANLGAYMSLFSSSVPTYLYATLLSGQYNIPAIHANVRTVYTNTVPVDAYRGAGRPEATYLMERVMETAARELGVTPAALRRTNFIREFPHQTPVIMCYDAGDYEASLSAAMKASDYDGFPARKAEAKSRGKLRGIGMSCYIEACGIAPSAAVGSLGAGVGLWESAEVRVNAVGTVEILTGSHSHGQGHETTFAQLVAGRFGVGIDSVSVVHGDTDKVQMGMGTYGSRSGAVGMSAVVKALDKVEAKAKKIAAHLMEADESDIVIENGELKVAGTDKSVPWFQMALAAYTAHNLPQGMEPGLKEGAFYDPSNFTFPAGCYICEVEVDPETGKTEIVQFVAADDFGKIINPMIVEGQVHGGLAQGIGQALLEGTHYDPENGQLLTASYMDYTMPRADDLPSFQVSTTETACPSNPLGIKGCGEAGAIGSPPALINAITDAIGNNDLTMPATAERVWAAIRSAQ
ncbi:MAG: molybdopterin-dependent oxidoreductase, partial [Hoeflea sp.]|uniref:xanthine dehydrogenase family protein molybdopterin-binding subunit n=1 Tax=Hoeflea sp. TaxID=1940281 RepID=UPI00272F47E7